MAVKFNQAVRHGTAQLLPDVAVAFEDSDADAYFIGMGWAASTTDAPVYTYSKDEVSIDPETVFGDGPNKGKPVLASSE